MGLDFRMTEIAAAVILAQLGKLDRIRDHLHANKQRFKDGIADLPGLEFRHLPDPEGELATLLTVFLPTEEAARGLAADLKTRVVAESGWHVYRNMEHLLQKRVPTAEGWPDTHPRYSGDPVEYYAGMLPQTDALLSRAINIGIGVRDPGLGSAFGVSMRDGADIVDARVAEFRAAAKAYLG
jgi:8-amino-3,8-dideoxy-alpha-D-manno-octulosonate transaminase